MEPRERLGQASTAEPLALAELPTGTVTFLFTDIEGSTLLLRRSPDAYPAALLRHFDLLRATVAAHAGHVFNTGGDAVYAVFRRTTDAVAAAVEGQRALLSEPWGEIGPLRVRMGVHTGEAERQGEQHVGLALHHCARIMATAHGGQIVLSGATCRHLGCVAHQPRLGSCGLRSNLLHRLGLL